ncbi:MAG TPA: NAD(P)H-dependent glycerol-3-phosphate dehydrogenase [Chloroflexota bacterium]|nr:NAD(P)H-dependent glycerol-3-phosphate dehydrogenase [Chloroflexota bacterium]
MKVDEKICVLNAGGWGTALAVLLSGKGYDVRLWARRPELAREIGVTRENLSYLPGVSIPRNVLATSDLREAVDGSSVVVVATIFRGLKELAPRVGALLRPDQLVVCAAKGLDEETLRRGSELLENSLPADHRGRVAVLSGPNHAEEVSRGIPTATVVASRDEEVALRIQEVLSAPTFRVYTNLDIVGVELCGALKNVVAIAAGMSDGLGYGDNSKAALITRSLAEIGRLVVEEGAHPYTVAGLAGIGDIIATCTSHHSRNRAAGEAIARGKSVEQVIAGSPMVVEGIPTTRAILKLARQKGVEMPITSQVHAVLFEGISPQEGMEQLMMRESTSEPWM